MEVLEKKCTEIAKLEGVDFTGDATIVDHRIDCLIVTFKSKGIQTETSFGNEESIRSLHKELGELINYVDLQRKLGHAEKSE